ncbi:MAG: WhiB family transcriptional regulator [Actinomycetes bacterium]
MTVLFSELLVPGWSEGPDAKIGLREVTAPANTQVNGENFALPCHTVDPEIFFAETPAMIAFAKSLCGQCPVAQKCLTGAISREEPCGVWGGELFDNGRPIQAKRMPGRPRLRDLTELGSVASRVEGLEMTELVEMQALDELVSA